MNRKLKYLGLISGICGMGAGLFLLVAAIADLTVPRPLIVVFTAACLINAVLNFMNFRAAK